MNSLLLTRMMRTAVLRTATSTAPAAFAARYAMRIPQAFSTKAKQSGVPEEDYYDGHLLADQLEYLDDMIEKTAKMEEQMKELQEQHAMAVTQAGVKWMDAAEIDELFKSSTQKKQELAAQMAELKELMASARKTFAVDAPDGESDWHLKDEMAEINHIIDDAAVLEDKIAVLKLRKEQEEAVKTFAVDAPDGEPDARLKEELDELNHIIDDAAALEDKEAVLKKHKLESKLQKERARDPEHDW